MTTNLLDLNRLNELKDLLEDAFADMIIEYIHDVQHRLIEARDAFATQDIERLRRELHTLKGASANMGASEFSNLARSLELVCHTPPLPANFSQDLETLAQHFPATEQALRTWLAS